jgi:hypothetical protein
MTEFLRRATVRVLERTDLLRLIMNSKFVSYTLLARSPSDVILDYALTGLFYLGGELDEGGSIAGARAKSRYSLTT